MSENTQPTNQPQFDQAYHERLKEAFSKDPVQTQTEQIPVEKFVLKKGFKINPDQRKKILGMPLKGFVSKMNTQTNEMEVPVGHLGQNQTELCDYLICLLFEKSDGSQVTEQDFCEMETSDYKELETKVKNINPFGVFDVKPV